MKPLIHPALPGEGVWKKAAAHAGPRPPVLLTTFRSDPEYPKFVAGVAWIDSTRTRLAYVPGLAEPPPPLSHRGPAEVPASMRKRVVATFNGGFPLETSNAGLIYRGKVEEAMVNGIATVVEYRDGRVDVIRWHQGPGAPANVWFAKQNLPAIIEEGRLNPYLGDGPEWGETVNNAVRVWRSGIGVDSHGNLLYAAANFQTVESLAKILQAGRCRSRARARHQRRLDELHQLSPPGGPGPQQPAAGNVPARRSVPDPRRTRLLRRLPAGGRKVVRLPRDISPGTAARRSLLVDVLIALSFALLAFQLAAGVGVVGFIALLTTLVLLVWIGVEAAVRRQGRRGKRRGRGRADRKPDRPFA